MRTFYKRNIRSVVCIILYRLLMDVIFYSHIAKYYTDYGFADRHSIWTWLISWLLLIIPIKAAIHIANFSTLKISNMILYILFLMSYVPFTALIGSGSLAMEYMIGNFIFWIILIFLQWAKRKKKVKPFPKLLLDNTELDDKVAIIMGLVSMLIVVYVSYKYTNFRINLSIENVYTLRNEAANYTMSSILGYLFSWTRAINTLMIGYCVIYEKKIATVMFAIAQILSFGVDGMKTTLFLTIIVLVFTIIYKHIKRLDYTSFLSFGMAAVTLLAILEGWILKTEIIVHNIFFRMLFFPVQIGSWYFDFFSHNTPDYYRLSFLRHLGFVSPYTYGGKGIEYLINDRYYGLYEARTNNGLISDAMTNMGIWGIIIYPILLVAVFKLIDKCAVKVNNGIFFVISLYVATSLINTFLFTALMTGGIIILCLVVHFINMGENSNEKDMSYYK